MRIYLLHAGAAKKTRADAMKVSVGSEKGEDGAKSRISWRIDLTPYDQHDLEPAGEVKGASKARR